jgi:hypothetical protein
MFTKIQIANEGFVIESEVKQSLSEERLGCRVDALLAMTVWGEVACV